MLLRTCQSEKERCAILEEYAEHLRRNFAARDMLENLQKSGPLKPSPWGCILHVFVLLEVCFFILLVLGNECKVWR